MRPYFSSVAGCKVEQDLGSMVGSGGGGSGKEEVPDGFEFEVTRRHQGVNSPLKVSRDWHRIRKRHQVQHRPPVIIYTYSPIVIHTRPDDFMRLVQKLTGSNNTRLSLKKSSQRGQQARAGATVCEETANAVTELERQGSGASFSATAANCGSTSSSEDLATLVLPGQRSQARSEAATCTKPSNSPRSPLDSSFELGTAGDSQADQFSGFANLPAGNSVSNPQVDTEPQFPFLKSNSSNFFPDFMQHGPETLQAATSEPTPRPTRSRSLDSVNPYVDNAAPSLWLLSPSPMAGFPGLSSQSHFPDCLNGVSAPPSSHFAPSLRQRHGYNPSPEGGPMVALENIHPFKLT